MALGHWDWNTPRWDWGHSCLPTGVTTSSVLDNIVSPPELFPPGHPDLPDIIFFFRYKQVTGGDTHPVPPLSS